MGNMEVLTVFVVCMNVFMWMTSLAITDINPQVSYYNVKGSYIEQTLYNNNFANSSVVNNNVLNDLPNSQGTVTTGSTGFFTDIFNNIISWIKGAPGVKYLYGIVSAPFNILNIMGLPSEIVAALGVLWYMISLLVILSYLWGR